MEWIDSDHFKLTSGKKVTAWTGTIGIDRELEVHTGSDDDIEVNGDPTLNEEDFKGEFPWTKEEKTELADYMINLWERFKTMEKLGEKV